MKIEKLIALVDELKENTLHEETKINWINEVEGRVFCELYKKHPSDFSPHFSMDDEISVPEPYVRMFTAYILGMIAFAAGEFDAYSRAMIDYETVFSEYARFLLRSR